MKTDTITIEKIIAAMARVPEKKLRIIELANSMTGPDGKFDFDRVQSMQAEVNLARAEAMAYARDTETAVNALGKLKARHGGSL